MDKIFIYFTTKLPEDIVSFIFGYSYTPQKKELLNDILHFITIKKQLLTCYSSTNSTILYNQYKYFLLSDILFNINNHIDIGYNFTDSFYNVFFRLTLLKTHTNVHTYIKKLVYRPIDSQINILLALMKQDDRQYLYSIKLFNDEINRLFFNPHNIADNEEEEEDEEDDFVFVGIIYGA
jgi:hypothetical protein